jgi:hypothetical protein
MGDKVAEEREQQEADEVAPRTTRRQAFQTQPEADDALALRKPHLAEP